MIEDKVLYANLKGADKNSGEAQYYAKKSGKLAKSEWVNVGVNKYYCGSSGKVKKHVINNT